MTSLAVEQTGLAHTALAEQTALSKDLTFLNEIAQITAKRVALIDALPGALEAV